MPMKRSIVASLLCIVFTVMLFDTLLAQDTRQRRQRPRRMMRWTGPEIGTVIADFELKTYEGKVFKLSEHRDKIVVLEMGACT